MPNTTPPVEPTIRETEWTPEGHRLRLAFYPDSFLIDVETQWLGNGGGRTIFILGRIAIVNGSMLTHAMGFAAHAIGYYQDDALVQLAREAVQQFFDQRKPIADDPRPAPVPSNAN